jgi:hypothetical protein
VSAANTHTRVSAAATADFCHFTVGQL